MAGGVAGLAVGTGCAWSGMPGPRGQAVATTRVVLLVEWSAAALDALLAWQVAQQWDGLLWSTGRQQRGHAR